MRFFKPTLHAQVKARSFFYTLEKGPLQSIEVSTDLSKLFLYYNKDAFKKNKMALQLLLKKSIEAIPADIQIASEPDTIALNNFDDISLALRKTVIELKETDPVFFKNLEAYEEGLLSDFSNDTEDMPAFLTISPLRIQYFLLQALRQNNVQHTLEIPLKELHQNGFIDQKTFHTVIGDIWINASAMRKAAPAFILPELNTMPYPFQKGY